MKHFGDEYYTDGLSYGSTELIAVVYDDLDDLVRRAGFKLVLETLESICEARANTEPEQPIWAELADQLGKIEFGQG